MAMTVNEDGSTSSSIHQRQKEKRGKLTELQDKLKKWSKKYPARDQTTRMKKYKKQ